MLHILFDFEIDTSIPIPHSKPYCEMVRAFYSNAYSRYCKLIGWSEDAGFFPIVMLQFSDDGIKSFLFDMPDVVAQLLRTAITQRQFELFEQELLKAFPFEYVM